MKTAFTCIAILIIASLAACGRPTSRVQQGSFAATADSSTNSDEVTWIAGDLASRTIKGQAETDSTDDSDVSDDTADQTEDSSDTDESSDISNDDSDEDADTEDTEDDADAENGEEMDEDTEIIAADLCCVMDDELGMSHCGAKLCLVHEISAAVAMNGDDFQQTIGIINESRYNFRNSEIHDFLPTIDIDGHVYPVVHEVRDDRKDEMDTEIFWTRDRIDCRKEISETLTFRVNPLMCADETIELTASFEAKYIDTIESSKSLRVLNAEIEPVQTLPGKAYWIARLEKRDDEAYKLIDTVIYFSKIFSEKVEIETIDDAICLLEEKTCNDQSRKAKQLLLVLWLNLASHKVNPCQTVSLCPTDGRDRISMTIRELIANLERALSCEKEAEIATYLELLEGIIESDEAAPTADEAAPADDNAAKGE